MARCWTCCSSGGGFQVCCRQAKREENNGQHRTLLLCHACSFKVTGLNTCYEASGCESILSADIIHLTLCSCSTHNAKGCHGSQHPYPKGDAIRQHFRSKQPLLSQTNIIILLHRSSPSPFGEASYFHVPSPIPSPRPRDMDDHPSGSSLGS